MARKLDKQKAINMRLQGMSYSQIKEELKVGKATLSAWLYNLPLPRERINELRADNPIRIEKFRNTMREKREARLAEAYSIVSKKIKKLSDRELFLAGLFLYWGEGSKTINGIGLTNTNPYMMKFYLRWLKLLNVKAKQLKVHLHLYSDMDIKKQEKFWSKELSIPLSQFRKSYIKKTVSTSITYHNGFGQGTCSVIVEDIKLHNEILMAIKYIQNNFT